MYRTPKQSNPGQDLPLLMRILETESMELSNTVATSPSQLLIEAGRTERQYWRDLWRYRELFFFLAWRDLLVRYKQTVIGAAGAGVRPLLTMLVFPAVFRIIA